LLGKVEFDEETLSSGTSADREREALIEELGRADG
jgi:hypothetical protein